MMNRAMKNIVKSLLAFTASLLALNACQQEIIPENTTESSTHKVTFVVDDTQTKTTADINETEGTVVYNWTEADENRFTVYEIVSGVAKEAQATIGVLEGDTMTLMAEFEGSATPGATYQALFNKGVKSVQDAEEFDYDQESDVMISDIASASDIENDGVLLRFKREVAFAKATLKGITGMDYVQDATLLSTEGAILAAEYDYDNKAFSSTGSSTIKVANIDAEFADGDPSFFFVTLPTESVNLTILVTALDDKAEEHLFVKKFARPIDFTRGDVRAFNVSGLTEVNTKVTFCVNGVETVRLAYNGTPIEFPEVDAIAGYEFMGWAKTAIEGTLETAPKDMVDPATEVMGAKDVTYYAVFAKASGNQTVTNVITPNTENIPTSYAAADNYTLNGVAFNITQMYKNGEKLQWRAAGHSNGTGTMYNQDKLKEIQSVAITYDGSDTKKNFTVKVGNSANPTEGTEITATQVGETSTYLYDCSSIAPSYFVLTNGENAGYLTSIVITYNGGEVTYSDYCTSIDTRTVTSLEWSASTYTANLNGENTYPTLVADPEEIILDVEYSSSKESIATISNDGIISLSGGVGETTITASYAGDDDYQPAEATFTLMVVQIASHTATFISNGTTISSETYFEGDAIEFPNDPSVEGVKFMGWATSSISGTQPNAPTFVNTEEETMGTSNATYYAVYAKETTSGTFTDTKLSSNAFESGVTYVLVAEESSSSKTLHYFSSYTGTTANESWGVTSTIAAEAITFTLSGTAKALVAQDNSGNYLQALATGKFRMSSTSTTLTLNDDGTIYNPTSESYNLRYNHNGGSGGFRWYNGSTGTSAYFYKRVADVSYSDYCTTVVTLSSIAVSGNPTKTTYFAGESFDPAGLTVTGTYSDNSKSPITEGISWTITPSGALTAGTTAVSVIATVKGKTSEAYTINGIIVKELSSISVKTAPSKVVYSTGEKFDPTGLEIYKNYSDATREEYAYADHEDEFTFTPALTTALTTDNDKVTITYQGKSVDQAITVTTPTFSSLEGLVAADLVSGTTVTVSFENVPIKSIYVSGTYRNGIYFDIQKGGKDIEIYYQDVPDSWVAGGAVSGTMTCPWKYYNGTWELAPAKDTWNWNNLTYTAPTMYDVVVPTGLAGGTVSASIYEAPAGATVTLTATPAQGYQFVSWSVKDASDNDISVTNNAFTMPASDVTVSAEFETISAGEEVTLFKESFGDNSGSARNWSDSYSVKSGISSVYSNAGYTITNAKQGKNTTGSTKSGLNQSTQNQDAIFEVGPLNVSGYSNLSLSYMWKAASVKGTYSTSVFYKTSKDGAYEEIQNSAVGATTFVEVNVNLPELTECTSLYLKIVFNTSNSQAIIDEVELKGIN